MDEIRSYPTWEDVGVTPLMVNAVKNLNSSRILDYLVLNRVFRFIVKAQCFYKCSHCGYGKKSSRIFEDYSSCESCGSLLVSSVFNWRMGKDQLEDFSSDENLSVRVIEQMPRVYGEYFKDYPPDNFLHGVWDVKKPVLNIDNKPDIYGKLQNSQHNYVPGSAPSYVAKFCCGEEVRASNPTLAIAKAAVLCPFLWDDCYDWKFNSPKDRSQETHLLPIFNLWAQLILEDSERSPSRKRKSQGGGNMPQFAEPQAHRLKLPKLNNSDANIPALISEMIAADAFNDDLFNEEEGP